MFVTKLLPDMPDLFLIAVPGCKPEADGDSDDKHSLYKMQVPCWHSLYALLSQVRQPDEYEMLPAWLLKQQNQEWKPR